jgi:hypothetical protein
LRIDSPENDAYNNELIGANAFGIGPAAMGQYMDLGFINTSTRQAIEFACTCELPRDGSKITVRDLDLGTLGAMAILMLRESGDGPLINIRLAFWISAVHQYGIRQASISYREFAGEFNDSMVTSAVQVIIKDDDRWPSVEDKVSRLARILRGEFDKASVRRLVNRGMP